MGPEEIKALLGAVRRLDSQALAGRICGGSVTADAVGALGTAGPFQTVGAAGGRGEVRAWNVFARAEVVGPVVGTPTFAAVGRLLWSIDGAKFSADFDILLGTRLTILADEIQLLVANESGIAPPVTPTGRLQISGGIFYGDASQPNAARRTRYGGSLLANSGSTIDIAIPDWARWWTVGYAPNNPGVATQLDSRTLNSVGAVIENLRWNLAAAGQQQTTHRIRVDIADDARTIRFDASTVGAIDRFRVTFGLAL